MRDDFVEAGTLEIHRYVPPALLKGKDLGAMDIDEFLQMFAYARYLEEVEEKITARAISEVFSED
ncbi:hypothetical protein [Caproicibacter sp.]|uniref:hypothetical protein n=1 Tax=Caproicibacter sp. TaxID=2814884 RepID=UPI00398A37B6